MLTGLAGAFRTAQEWSRMGRGAVCVLLIPILAGCDAEHPPLSGQFEVQGPVYEIGSSGTDESQTYFGDATDAILLPGDSVLLILDNIQKNLSLVSVSGERIFRVGRPGGGPEEFRHSDGLALQGSTAWVLDRGNGRTALFELQGDTIAFVRVIPLPLNPEGGGMCVTSNEAYFYGGWEEKPIHRFDQEGNYQQSIGTWFGDPGEQGILREASTDGPFRCDEARDEILATSRLLGVVRSYHQSGELRWERQIPTFARLEMSTTEGGYRFSNPSEPNEDGVADLLVTIFTVGGIVGVQEASDVRRNSDRDLVDVRTTILDRATGEVLHRTQELPHIKRVIRDWAISVVNDPYPVVRLYRWTLE